MLGASLLGEESCGAAAFRFCDQTFRDQAMIGPRLVLIVCLAGAAWPHHLLAAGLDPAVVARRADELVAKDLGSADQPAPAADDQTFLRRVALDLVGYS